jgi:hypothetical protein
VAIRSIGTGPFWVVLTEDVNVAGKVLAEAWKLSEEKINRTRLNV